MTQTETSRTPHSLGSSIRSLADKWAWIVGLGVLFVIAGALALITVVPATVVSVLWVGAFMLLAGVGEVIAAFQFKDWSRFTLWMVMGLMYIVAGLMTFFNPLLAAVSLTLLIGVALVAAGAIRIWLASQIQDVSSWAAVAFSGVITTLLGIMILAKWPVSGLYVLGIFLGLDLLFAGFAWIATGTTIRRLTDGK